MNKKNYLLYIDLMNMIMQFLVSYTVMTALFAYTVDLSVSWISLSLFPVPFLSYVLGKYTDKIWKLLFSHILIFAVYFMLISSLLQMIVYAVYILFLAAFQLKHRMKEEQVEKEITSLGFLAVFFVMSILSRHLGQKDMQIMFFVFAIFYVLLYLVGIYLRNLINYMQMYEKTTNRPDYQFKRTNHLLLIFFQCICIAVMIIFSMVSVEGIGTVLKRVLVWLIRGFLSFFHETSEEPQEMEPESYQNNNMMGGDFTASVFFQILDFLFTLAVIAGAVAVVLYGLYRIYQLFYHKRNYNETEQVEFVSPFDKRTSVRKERPKSGFNRLRLIFGPSNNERIRKLFYKAIIAHAKPEQLTGSMTPSQLSKFAYKMQNRLLKDTADSEKEEELTYLYEKARYGKTECGKEELQKVKELLR